MKSIKNLISLGYLLMALLVIGIMYIWYKEWCDLEKLEVQNRHIWKRRVSLTPSGTRD